LLKSGRVCRYHGGAAPQATKKAAERLQIVAELTEHGASEKLPLPRPVLDAAVVTVDEPAD
jgi:hypothetical protein